MKKIILIFIILVIVVFGVVLYKYNDYKNEMTRLQKLNDDYETFTNSEIIGTSLITIINKAIDSNERNNISKDKEELYIENDSTSIKIEVKFNESDNTYSMERIGKAGSENFIKNYGTANFRCTKKEYHEKTKMIKYLLFEQI